MPRAARSSARGLPCRERNVTAELVRGGGCRDLLLGTSLYSDLASVALGLAVMLTFRLINADLLNALPSG